MPQQIRSALAGAEKAVAQNAARRLRTGEALCRANNQRGAAKEFQVALKLLGANGALASSPSMGRGTGESNPSPITPPPPFRVVPLPMLRMGRIRDASHPGGLTP
jgi:hypothetical protein